MPRPRKQPKVIDEETIAAPPEIENQEEVVVANQDESINGDSSPLTTEKQQAPEVAPTNKVAVITPAMIKVESMRLIPLLVEAIKYLLSKKPLTPNALEIIKKRLESTAILLDAVKRMDV